MAGVLHDVSSLLAIERNRPRTGHRPSDEPKSGARRGGHGPRTRLHNGDFACMTSARRHTLLDRTADDMDVDFVQIIAPSQVRLCRASIEAPQPDEIVVRTRLSL